MNKTGKKLISLLGALAMTASLAVMPAAAGPLDVYEDDIESHSVYVETGNGLGADYDANVPGVATGSGDMLVSGVWQTSPTFGGGGWATDYRIQKDKQYANSWNNSDGDVADNVIRMRSLSIDGNYQAAVNLIADVSSLGDSYMYQVDLRSYFGGACTPVMGIRLGDPDDETNYYELAVFNNTGVGNSKADAQVSAPRFTKVQGATATTPAVAAVGAEPTAWKYTEYGKTATASGLYVGTDGNPHHTDWFTLTIARQKDTFSWSVVEKKTGEVIWSDSWTDESPLFEDYAKLQIFEYGGGDGCTFANNVVCKKLGMALYRNEANKTGVFTDTLESYTAVSATNFNPNGDTNYSAEWGSGNSAVLSGGGLALVEDVWQTSPKFDPTGGTSLFAVTKDTEGANTWGNVVYTDDTVLFMQCAGCAQVAVDRISDVSAAGDSYQYTADIRNYFNGSSNGVMGIRIMDPDNSANYYEIALISGTGTDKVEAAPRFTKVIGGTETTPTTESDAWKYTEYSPVKTVSGLNGSYCDWYTLTLGKTGSTISWSVKNKGTGEVIWEDSWVDESPLFTKTGKLQAFTCNGAATLNNVTLETVETGDLQVQANWICNGDAPFMVVAGYDANNKLLVAKQIKAGEGTFGSYDASAAISNAGDTIRAFMWNTDLTPVQTDVEAVQ